jgi:SAM-dependent methyltransferase
LGNVKTPFGFLMTSYKGLELTLPSDFADARPEAEVIGTDISPSQPEWVPPNLKFEIEDCTQPWTYPPDTFDFVHLRYLFGAISDWDALIAEAFKACKPGGWVETVDPSVNLGCDDGSVREGTALYDWGRLFNEVSNHRVSFPFSHRSYSTVSRCREAHNRKPSRHHQNMVVA